MHPCYAVTIAEQAWCPACSPLPIVGLAVGGVGKCRDGGGFPGQDRPVRPSGTSLVAFCRCRNVHVNDVIGTHVSSLPSAEGLDAFRHALAVVWTRPRVDSSER